MSLEFAYCRRSALSVVLVSAACLALVLITCNETPYKPPARLRSTEKGTVPSLIPLPDPRSGPVLMTLPRAYAGP